MSTETWVMGHLISVRSEDDCGGLISAHLLKYRVAVDHQLLRGKSGRARVFRSRVAAHQAGLRRVEELTRP